MTSSPQELQLHTIDRTPEYEDFMNRLREYHARRGTTLDPEPKVGLIHLDLFKVFNQIVANGGYDKVSEEKLAWRRMASELGLFSNNEASTAFSLKEKFYKNLAAFEISTVHGKEPPPKDILEEVTAKGASLLTRTRENFRTKRDSGNVNTTDSAASGEDGTPARERPVAEKSTASSRASRGLREAPAQRVIFQPDTGSNRATRHSVNQQQHASHGTNLGMMQAPHLAGMNSMPPGSLNQGSRGPAILHHPPNSENSSQLVQSYQPKQLKPLPFRVAATPSSAPGDFSRPGLPRRSVLVDSESRQSIVPGTGCEGPNIYTRCMNALRSGLPAEEAFALSHLVKISYERGDKFKFDVFPGLAESLIDKALQVGNLFYHVDWTVSWDFVVDSTDVGCLDGNNGTPDILERIESLVEKDVLEVLHTESFSDKLVLIVEAVLTIRNMVTLSENAQYMADCSPLKDLVCIILHLPNKDCVVELKHMALDIAEQLTPFMVLEADDALYTALLGQLASEDRGTILTALRALGRISMNLEATNALADVTVKSLQRITHWLLLNDDELIDACLDFLYQYTAVVANLENLVRSVAIEDLVEHLTRLLSHGARKTQKEWILFPEQRVPSRDEITPVPEDLLRELVKLEEPERVHRWVKCFFDEDDHSSVTQIAAWQAYQSAFSGPLEAAGKSLITPAEFIRNTTSVYKKSNAQVVRDPGEASQKFIIHGIRARARPLSIDGTEYGRCLWATNAEKKNEKCGQFCLKPEQMAEHILTAHLSEKRNAEGKFTNVEREFRCTWGECFKYEKATEMRLRDFVRHINTHILALLPGAEAQTKRHLKPWVMPAKTISMACEETMTVRDETNANPHAAPEAAGIPLSAVLVLRNIARNVVKTDAEEELVKQRQTSGGERGGWNERLFRPVLRRLFDILTKNRALSPYIASLLDLIRTNWEVSEESIA